MTKNDTEADARLLIDVMLRQAGWDRAEKSQVRTARRKDYILNSSKGQPIVDEIAENDLNLGAGRYKPQVGEQPP